MNGRIVIIGTPIGNLDDLSQRAIRALEECDLLLCEDTRHTGKLLERLGIDARLESFHDHNEDARVEPVLERLRDGMQVGLVSDAGMPLVSDPGFPLLRAARDEGIEVTPVPGPSAVLLALAASGLPPTPFSFHGFAPNKHGERLEFYHDVARRDMTAVVFESPHRIVESLADALSAMGDVQMTMARELTKLHEEFLHGTVSQVVANLKQRGTIRGEITLVFAAPSEDDVSVDLPSPTQLRDELASLRDRGMRRNDAVKALGEKYGLSRNEVYRLVLEED